MVIQTGVFTERLFSKVLNGLGYHNLAANYKTNTLRQLLRKFDSNRLDWLDVNYGTNISATQITDYAFGVDYLINVEPTNQRIGLDFTINGSAIERKLDKIVRNKHLWSKLDIDIMIVVHFQLPVGEDQGLLFYDLEDCEDQLLDAVFSSIESKQLVVATTVKVNRK